MPTLEDRGVWPNFTQAAAMLGLSKGTLSKCARRGQITYDVLGLGQGRHVLSPREVLRISGRYQRVPQDILLRRLAEFLAARLRQDADEILQVLLPVAATMAPAASTTLSPVAEQVPDGPPRWLAEVDCLLAEPAVLTGTLTFTSPDELYGAIALGPSVDDPDEASAHAWAAPQAAAADAEGAPRRYPAATLPR